MSSGNTCEIPDVVVETFRKMKMSKSKTNNVLVLKINPKTLEVEVDEQLEGFTWAQLQDELPESTPRYLAISYAWNMGDDRVSYPLVFIYYAPECSSKINMLYASTKARLAKALELNKEFESRDKNELTKEWLEGKLQFFKA